MFIIKQVYVRIFFYFEKGNFMSRIYHYDCHFFFLEKVVYFINDQH